MKAIITGVNANVAAAMKVDVMRHGRGSVAIRVYPSMVGDTKTVEVSGQVIVTAYDVGTDDKRLELTCGDYPHSFDMVLKGSFTSAYLRF